MSSTDLSLSLSLIKRDGEMLLASLTALYSSIPRTETQSSISPFTRLIKLHTAAKHTHTQKHIYTQESVLF